MKKSNKSLFARIIQNPSAHLIQFVLGILLTPIVGYFLIRLFSDPQKEEYEHSLNQRPLLEMIGDPIVDSIVFRVDSLGLLQYYYTMNKEHPEITAHPICPEMTVYYQIKLTNTGNALASREVDVYTDTLTDEFFLRNQIKVKRNYHFELNTDYFAWRTIAPFSKDTIIDHFVQEIQFNSFGAKGTCKIHLLLLYRNDNNVLFDTYIHFVLGFNYPHIRAFSERNKIFRTIEPPLSATTKHEYWIKKRAPFDTKNYTWEEATEIRKLMEYYYREKKNVKYTLGD